MGDAHAGGWLLTYFCNHAIGHWTVGRLVGIRFLGYEVHGTTAPGWYPPGMRWIFRHVPLFSTWTDPASRRAVHPLARMLMYLGGPLFTGLTRSQTAANDLRERIPQPLLQ